MVPWFLEVTHSQSTPSLTAAEDHALASHWICLVGLSLAGLSRTEVTLESLNMTYIYTHIIIYIYIYTY